MTQYQYIHEFDFLENSLTLDKEIYDYTTEAYNKYLKDHENARMKLVFENADYGLLCEEAETGFFARIGKSVSNMIENIKKYLDKFIAMFSPKKRQAKEQERLAKELVRQYPKKGQQLVDSMLSGAISVKDYDALLKTSKNLMDMYERDKMTKDEYEDRMEKALKDFDKKSNNILSGVKTFAALTGIVGTLIASIDNISTGIDGTKTLAEKFKSDLATHKINNPGTGQSIMKTLLKIESTGKIEASNRYKLLGKVSAILGKFNKSAGDKVAELQTKVGEKDAEKIKKSEKKYGLSVATDANGNDIRMTPQDRVVYDKKQHAKELAEKKERQVEMEVDVKEKELLARDKKAQDILNSTTRKPKPPKPSNP